jgi:ElaB/YqjD/DUF883 family membrane-anchored ribosome-binding protein
MADLKKAEKDIKDTIKKEKEALTVAYGDMLNKLKSERDKISKDIQSEYKNAKKYVKKNPETGLGVALAGGLVVGFILAKILKR